MVILATEIRDRLEKGRAAYRRQSYVEALGFDEEALALAREAGERSVIAVCLRYVGLCHYRIGGHDPLARSEECFREALGLADALGDRRLRLVVSNHIGATLRDQGRHDEGYDLFREALREATGDAMVDLRARLLGNLGALLDELEQRASADDCYARYEELLERSGDAGRLANARGLAGRAALLRGDLDEAAWRFDDELRRGELLDDSRRRISALRHQAHLAMARVARASRDESHDLAQRAEDAYARAHRAAEESGDRKDQIRLALQRVEFLRRHGRTGEAHQTLVNVRAIALDLDHPALSPRVDHASAQVCADAGLHGEALWYLSRAARRRVAVIKSLKNERVRAMAGAWLEQLRVMANELHQEVFRVPRTASERARFEALLDEVRSAVGDIAPAAHASAKTDAWQWHEALRAQSRARWGAILGESFKRLSPDSQSDLLRADVTYHGAVDDLGRSAHLLALVLERELRERVFVPFKNRIYEVTGRSRKVPAEWQPIVQRSHPPTLGPLLAMIPLATGEGGREHFEAKFGRARLDGLTPIAELCKSIRPVEGAQIDVVDVRNDVAHGRSSSESLDRVAVDAIKRALFLDTPAALEGLLAWPPMK